MQKYQDHRRYITIEVSGVKELIKYVRATETIESSDQFGGDTRADLGLPNKPVKIAFVIKGWTE